MEKPEQPKAIEEAKVVQIIPAERGWHVSGYETHGYKPGGDPPLQWFQEVVCWALMSDGAVRPMIRADDSSLWPVVSTSREPYERFSLYSPVQSFDYEIREGRKPPDDGDWELCGIAIAQSDDSGLFVYSSWRQPHHGP